MTSKTATLFVGLTVFCLAGFCLTGDISADWDPGDPFKMHFPQLPDLTPEGLDVANGAFLPFAGLAPFGGVPETFLADDWLCTSSGPVTGIHFWGSYLDDQQIMESMDAADAYFTLAIYSDVPATAGGFSMPGDLLWETYVQPTSARLYATADERYYDPIEDAIVGTDTEVWQFNFDIPEADAFEQTAGDIYWLGIHHTFDLNGDGFVDGLDFVHLNTIRPAGFGWKTSQDHFNDDAVFAEYSTLFTVPPGGQVPGAPVWNEMIYPSSHPFGGQSIDLSFVIVPEPSGWLLLLLGSGLLGVRRRSD